MTRETFMELDDRTLQNSYLRPSQLGPEREYWPVPRSAKAKDTRDITLRELFFHPARVEALRAAGVTDEELEKRYREWARSYSG